MTAFVVNIQTSNASQVLRFFAYVKEPLLEVAPEAYRVRHCIMLHHLEDATLAINEPRQPGSSFPWGPVLKRHKCGRHCHTVLYIQVLLCSAAPTGLGSLQT